MVPFCKPLTARHHRTCSLHDGAAARTQTHGRVAPYLTSEELHYLRIPQGSLDEKERIEAESHAAQTYDFLAQIPWTDPMKDIAMHASGHHEKLDGSGYPNRLKAEDIPLQTRLIAVADVSMRSLRQIGPTNPP